ncbi:unnamed protein product [Taenia asiatica]|uniref:Aurora kinase A and ninein-interacting protein n=1 Tax=Taenia asiatica TaxID=60517 RepID=A0A0R3W5Y7_TAEAS|nr:unnamed protein product [Taenia asiatica]
MSGSGFRRQSFPFWFKVSSLAEELEEPSTLPLTPSASKDGVTDLCFDNQERRHAALDLDGFNAGDRVQRVPDKSIAKESVHRKSTGEDEQSWTRLLNKWSQDESPSTQVEGKSTGLSNLASLLVTRRSVQSPFSTVLRLKSESPPRTIHQPQQRLDICAYAGEKSLHLHLQASMHLTSVFCSFPKKKAAMKRDEEPVRQFDALPVASKAFCKMSKQSLSKEHAFL